MSRRCRLKPECRSGSYLEEPNAVDGVTTTTPWFWPTAAEGGYSQLVAASAIINTGAGRVIVNDWRCTVALVPAGGLADALPEVERRPAQALARSTKPAATALIQAAGAACVAA